ncbi:MAG: antirestriction protein ArdA [Candidatus Coprovivens sp.]
MKNVLNVKVVVGAWKAYNECNERSLGSEWIDLTDFDSFDDVIEELKNQGFTDDELEETFIQDIEADVDLGINCDYTNIEDLFLMLEELDNLDLCSEAIQAYIETVGSLDDLLKYEPEIYWYDNMDLEDVAYELMHDCYDIPDYLENYIDYSRFAQDLSLDGFYECSNGVLEVR